MEKPFALIAAPHTPFTDEGTLRLESVEPQIERLVRDGVAGAFVCGTTGEGLSLSTEERKALAARWVALRPAGFRVFVHVGHNALPDAMALAQHAQAVGADAIAALPPHYFVPEGIDPLIDFLAPVAAAAPELPFFYYHLPALTGVNLPVAAFLERAATRIPTLEGVKFSEPDLYGFEACRHVLGGRLTRLWGSDQILLMALLAGADGAVGSTYNHAASLYHRMRAALLGGDLEGAQAHSAGIMAMVRATLAAGGIASQKALLTRAGIPLGAPRLPLRPLDPAAADALYARFVAEGWI